MTLAVAEQSSSVKATSTKSISASLSSSASSVNEGQTVTFTLSTDASEGTQFAWEISGVSSSDVSGGLTGTATLDANGDATIDVILEDDSTTEGSETMTLAVAGESSSVTVADTSRAPVTFTVSDAIATEGNWMTFTITRSDSQGSDLVYLMSALGTATRSGAEADYFSDTGYPLTFVDGESLRLFTVPTYSDALVEGTEYFILFLFEDLEDLAASNFSTFGYGFIADRVASSLRVPSDWKTQNEQSSTAFLSLNSDDAGFFPGHNLAQFRNDYAFAAINHDGTVTAWGDSSSGGDITSVSNSLVTLRKLYRHLRPLPRSLLMGQSSLGVILRAAETWEMQLRRLMALSKLPTSTQVRRLLLHCAQMARS